MASAFCRGCLSRLPRASFLPPPPTVPRTTTTATAAAATAGFHTSAVHYANPTKKSNSMDSGPKYRQAKSAKMKRKKPVERTRPPPIGERKALRNRIVLGNPNALEPADMQNLSVENMGDPRVRGTVVGLPVSMLEQLRSVHAFKKSQRWGLFRRPATFMRKEALEMGRLFEKISGEEHGKVVKKVITGKVGSGKSVFLTQAMAMGFLKNWVVLTVPETQELVNAHTGYAPLNDTNPGLYVQNQATSQLLQRTFKANEKVLSGLKVSQQHPALKSLVKPGMTLAQLTGLGIKDQAVAWPVFQALWAELTSTSAPRPPILVTVDGLSHWMQNSEYRTADFKPIHAHDLVFVRHFLSLLKPGANGKSTLPNGGLLLYATSGSNSPRIYSFDVALKQLEATTLGVNPKSPEFPQADAYQNPDLRVIEAFAAPQPASDKEGKLELQPLSGLTREDTVGYMEFWAKSGLIRQVMDFQWVSQLWTKSSGGIIGELLRLGSRLRVPQRT
ncbi:mitochondrial 37S ribosomal protein mS29 [Aspergillus chevalieri]|uniref:Small ribosomal subunit protein mS29 n=1 Tax=Aspergillus chevalieri TaxID=182096 RepID=A0A7R7VMX8_ASPCH|nr:37S ribosomal protein S23 mitochondrial [Aspergillus chevalieri]BCR87615.1 37S ribosomal protein S23 mitochondrial [Aspergillus chevalieri]